MDVYAGVFHRALQPAWESLRGRPTLSRLGSLGMSQWSSPDALREMQLDALRRLLRHAREHVPAHRERLQAAGVDPDGLRDVGELARLPLLTRDEVQARRAEFMSAAPGERVVHKSTSGSTGRPFKFAYSYESEIWRQSVKLRGWGWAGYVPGLRTVYYWGPPAVEPQGLQAAKITTDRALRREVYLDCARQSPADLRRAAETLRKLRPDVLVCYTQAAVELARFVRAQGLRRWPPMRVLCGAERLLPGDRALLEEAFGEPGSVFETYGCREFMLMGSECEAHEGLHQSMETLIIEIVDDEGRPVSPGTAGQVAVTDLYNYAMPLVRYLNGDLAVAAPPDARCPCGRGLLRLASVEGRRQDTLRGADGRAIPGMVFIALMANLGEQVRQYQAVQRRDGAVELRVVPGPRFEAGVLEGIKGRLRPYLADVPLSVTLVDEVPALPSGKRQFVVVER